MNKITLILITLILALFAGCTEENSMSASDGVDTVHIDLPIVMSSGIGQSSASIEIPSECDTLADHTDCTPYQYLQSADTLTLGKDIGYTVHASLNSVVGNPDTLYIDSTEDVSATMKGDSISVSWNCPEEEINGCTAYLYITLDRTINASDIVAVFSGETQIDTDTSYNSFESFSLALLNTDLETSVASSSLDAVNDDGSFKTGIASLVNNPAWYAYGHDVNDEKLYRFCPDYGSCPLQTIGIGTGWVKGKGTMTIKGITIRTK